MTQNVQNPAFNALEVVGSVDVLPCDFMCSAPIRKLLKDYRFGLVEDMKAAVVQWFWKEPRKSIAQRIHWLVCPWDAFSTPVGTR
jgi:hypothetical protein